MPGARSLMKAAAARAPCLSAPFGRAESYERSPGVGGALLLPASTDLRRRPGAQPSAPSRVRSAIAGHEVPGLLRRQEFGGHRVVPAAVLHGGLRRLVQKLVPFGRRAESDGHRPRSRLGIAFDDFDDHAPRRTRAPAGGDDQKEPATEQRPEPDPIQVDGEAGKHSFQAGQWCGAVCCVMRPCHLATFRSSMFLGRESIR